jgi:hypothetical protein
MAAISNEFLSFIVASLLRDRCSGFGYFRSQIGLYDSVIDGLYAKNMPRGKSSELQSSRIAKRAKAAHRDFKRAEIAQGKIPLRQWRTRSVWSASGLPALWIGTAPNTVGHEECQIHSGAEAHALHVLARGITLRN